MRTRGWVALLSWLAAVPVASAQEAPAPKVSWTQGPATVDVGQRAALRLPEGYLFAGAADTRAVLERLGNQTDGSELGLIVSSAQDENWMLIFEWRGIGYVRDDEKDRIDADALLKSIREATEEGNAWRQEHKAPALHVTGWAEPPHYDAQTQRMEWAILARNERGHESANYNVRVLGRDGVMSVTLVEGADRLAHSKHHVGTLLTGFSYKPGKRYAEWVPGDKVAQYGLVGLVAAGAGAAAVKLGLFAVLGKLLAKMGKLVVLMAAGVAGVAAKVWNAARGRMTTRRSQAQPGGTDPGPQR